MKPFAYDSLNEKQLEIVRNYTNDLRALQYKGGRHEIMQLELSADNMFLIAEALYHYADCLFDKDEEKAHDSHDIYQQVFGELFDALKQARDPIPCTRCGKGIIENEDTDVCSTCRRQEGIDTIAAQIAEITDKGIVSGWDVARKNATEWVLLNSHGQIVFTGNHREVAEWIDDMPF